MSSTPATPRETAPPLCVDLDGTLIRTDLMWESLLRLVWRNPLSIFAVLFWWTRGRAYLKQQLGSRVTLDATALPFNEPFLEFLRSAKRDGRRLFLVTASDRKMATPVFNHVGIFDELLASDGKTNLRGHAKAKVLVEQFGEHGFDYAGNSRVDLPVWAHAREAIVVNASHNLAQRAAQQTKFGPTFPKIYSVTSLAKIVRWPTLNLICAVLSGLLLATAFPKTCIAGFAWIAPALMLTAAHRRNAGDAFRLGYISGLAFWLASLYWLLLIPVKGYPILGWFALSAYVALFPATWLLLVSGKVGAGGWTQRMLWSLAGAAIWVALEMIRARLLSGFPWNPIGASQFAMLPLIQIASVTGVCGVSFIVVWLSLSLFSAVLTILHHPTARHVWLGEIILPLAVLMAVFGFGLARLRESSPNRPTLRVTFVQPSIPQTMIWDTSENSNRFRQVLELSERALAEKTDLLVWPEAALPDFNENSFTAITNLIRTHGVWMIFGADDVEWRANAKSRDDYDVFNAAFLFNPAGRWMAVYRKQKLVIFGEYIPLVHWLPFVKWFTPITGGFASGDKPVPFEMKWWDETPSSPDSTEKTIRLNGVSPHQKVKTSTLICFEDIFPHLVREYVNDDTDFLVNLTNDGWFGEGAEQWQHADMAVFRAVENGLPLLRCCNNGITCWVDSRGRIQQIFRDKSGSVYGVGSMTAQIPVLTPGEKRVQTFYNQYGDWFGWGCVAITVAVLIRKGQRRFA